MSNDKWSVRIHNGKGEHWDTVPAADEADARKQAANIAGANKTWRAFVRKNGGTVASYAKGKEYTPRAKRAPKPAPQNQSDTGKDVHTEHCCKVHGCKYFKADCPVVKGRKPQSFPCDMCELTPAEASAIQGVAEVEALKRELAAHRELWAHVCYRLGVPDSTDKQGALDAAIDAKAAAARDGALEEAAREADEEARHDREAEESARAGGREASASAFKARVVADTSIAEGIRALKSAPAEPVFTAAQVREAVEGVSSEGSGGGQYPLMQSTAREILKRLGLTR